MDLSMDSCFSISVIIPAHNAEGFIVECLDSIAAQTRLPYEVIVIDDGSVDQTPRIVQRYKPHGFTLRYIRQNNAGPSSARNAGIKVSNSNWIAFLDADDLWLPDKLHKQIDYLKANPQVSLLCSDASQFKNQKECIASSHARFGHTDFQGVIPDAFEKLLKANPILTGTVLIKKACLMKYGCFDESLRYGEDHDLWLRVAMIDTIACQPEALMRRRLHDENLSRNEAPFFESSLYTLKKVYDQSDSKELLKAEFLNTLKKYSYFLYIKSRYFSALIVLLKYIHSWLNLRLLSRPLANHPFERKST